MTPLYQSKHKTKWMIYLGIEWNVRHDKEHKVSVGLGCAHSLPLHWRRRHRGRRDRGVHAGDNQRPWQPVTKRCATDQPAKQHIFSHQLQTSYTNSAQMLCTNTRQYNMSQQWNMNLYDITPDNSRIIKWLSNC